MKILYSYIKVGSEGGKVHIDSFVKAYRSLTETVIENGLIKKPYTGGKESWSVRKRLKVRLLWFVENISNLWRTLRMARMNKPTVLLFRFQPIHEFLFSIVCLSFLYPVVLEINAVRSIEHNEGRPLISDFLDRISLRRAKRCFVVSERLKEHIIENYGFEDSRIAVIENGVDIHKFNPDINGREVRKILAVEDRFIIGFVGSFRPWHGIDHLIALAEKVVIQLPKVFFLLVGDGTDRQLYEKKVNQKRLSKYFCFTGHVPHTDIPKYLSSMDVVVYPINKKCFSGKFHGSPLKIFEYMAMAKPVLTSPLGQIDEIIKDGDSGLLIDPEDTYKVSQVILRLHDDRALRANLGLKARANVIKHYTWEINAEKVRNLCAEACNA